ncbi:hypothetical protein ACJIZ3_005433 [Penstemon smallii]|uniref:Uncharacterized protein n=1 Tax=Penstemon smallii TaxID=265156 RepID=A0ABD3S4W7_9LAMI
MYINRSYITNIRRISIECVILIEKSKDNIRQNTRGRSSDGVEAYVPPRPAWYDPRAEELEELKLQNTGGI